MRPCYEITGNWWLAILLFTAITKLVLLPLTLWAQRNSITMVELMPDLFRIKCSYFGDRETIDEKQNELYKERGYHALLSLVPLVVQIVILMGLADVIRGIAASGEPGTELMGLIPSENGGISWFAPVAAGLSAIAMGFASNRINPLQKEQSRAEKATTNGLSIALSIVLAVFVTCGMAWYWVCSNLLSILVQVICNIIINPKKYVDYDDLEKSRAEYEALEAATKSETPWYKPNPSARRAKEDFKRFFRVDGKHLVFYSEGSGFYKYFKGAIEWLLANTNLIIHYVTSDANDQVFALAEREPRIFPYFADQRRLITLMMKMDADVVVMSQDDLDNFYMKKSYVRKDIAYLYMCHHMTSFYLTGRKHAYDNYDAILCVGQEQHDELRLAEKVYGLPRKDLPLTGSGLLDDEIAAWTARAGVKNDPPVVLIAPSWQKDNLLDLCIDDMLGALLGRGWRVIVRPHPEYTKRYRPRWEALLARYADVPESELYFERDFSSNATVFESDVIITDWSTVNFEFSFCTLKPSLFINTPMKVNNPDYEGLGVTPTDITLRDEIGRSFDVDEIDRLPELVEEMLANPEAWSEKIKAVRSRHIANLGGGGAAAGEYIFGRVMAAQEAREGAAGAGDEMDAV